jgi:hypothetical protein
VLLAPPYFLRRRQTMRFELRIAEFTRAAKAVADALYSRDI